MQQKKNITRRKAAKAALKIIDENGIGGLSLQLVAKEMGIKPPSLYHHFGSKNEILKEVARLVLESTYRDNTQKHNDWKENLVELQLAARRAILKHPNAALLLLEFFPRDIMSNYYDEWIGTLKVHPEMLIVVIEGLEKLTFGSAIFSATHQTTEIEHEKNNSESPPNLTFALNSSPRDDEELFKETIRRYLASF